MIQRAYLHVSGIDMFTYRGARQVASPVIRRTKIHQMNAFWCSERDFHRHNNSYIWVYIAQEMAVLC